MPPRAKSWPCKHLDDRTRAHQYARSCNEAQSEQPLLQPPEPFGFDQTLWSSLQSDPLAEDQTSDKSEFTRPKLIR
jgi:hypothetical protein